MKIAASTALVLLSLPLSRAWAATGGREDHSPLVVWAFLGFCALIVVAQLVPAIREARRAAAEERERLAQARAVEVPVEE